jgi:WD40 repeat protein
MAQALLVTGGYDNTLRLWRADNGACIRTLQHNDSVSVRVRALGACARNTCADSWVLLGLPTSPAARSR